MNHKILHRTIREFHQAFKVDFNQLTDQDIQTILHGPSETLLAIFHKRYGYTPAQAIHAWNEFVLRRVDGAPSRTAANPVKLMA